MQCPQCKNDVPVTEAQYGALYTCPKCVAVYFVGFDGLPEYGDMEIPADQQMENVETDILPEEPINEYDSFVKTEEPAESFSAQQEMASSFEPQVENTFNTENNFEIQTFPETATGHDAFTAVAQEISNYGNQEEVISSISYDLIIKGLDTKEVMVAFKEAIDDSKFAWITQDILNQIKNGESVLKNLNPIQAFVLATRIQFLDLDIEWKQNVQF